MNSARSLTKGSLSIIRCSRHISYQGLSTTWSALKNNALRTGRMNVVKQTQLLQIIRPMSSTTKFEVINIQDEEDFKKRVLESNNSVPVVVDFHATWCGPCKILGPKLESLISKEEGKVLMVKVDIDQHPELAMEYGVQSIPTVVGMKHGRVHNKFVGVIEDDKLSSFVDELVIS